MAQEDTLIPPAWDVIEADPEYQGLSPEDQAQTLANWAKSTRTYGDQQGWWSDPDTQKQFTESSQAKLREIQAKVAPVTAASAGAYGDNPIAQTVGTALDRANLGVQEFAPRAKGAADQLLSLATRVPELVTSPIDAVAGTDLTKRYQEFNKIGQTLNQWAMFETQQAKDIQEAGRAIGGGEAIPLLGRPGDLLQEAIPTTLQAFMDIGLSGGGGTARSLQAPAKTALEAVMRATSNPAVKQAAYVAGGEQALATLNQEIQDRVANGESPEEAQVRSLPKSIAAGLVTMMTTRFGGTTGAESVLKESGVTGLKNRIVEVLKEGGMEAAEETLDQAANQIAGWMSDEFDTSKAKEGTWQERLARAVSIPELVKSGFLGGIIGSSITAVGQTTEAVRDRAIVREASAQAQNLEANNAPATARAVEQIAADQLTDSRIGFEESSPEERMDRAAEILGDISSPEEFAQEPTVAKSATVDDSQFAPPQQGVIPAVDTPRTEEEEQTLPEPEAAKAMVEEALLVGQEPNPADVELAGAAIASAQTNESPTPEAQATIPEAPRGEAIPTEVVPEASEGAIPESPAGEQDVVSYDEMANLAAGEKDAKGQRGVVWMSRQKRQQGKGLSGDERESNAVDEYAAENGYQRQGDTYSKIHAPTDESQSPRSEGEAGTPESAPTDQLATVSGEPPVASAATQSSEQQPIARVQLKGTPASFAVVEKIPQTEAEKERGEQFFRVVNERTSEEQIVEQNDIAREIKPKSERVKKAVQRLPKNQQAKAEAATTEDTSDDPYQGVPLSTSAPLELDDNLEMLEELSEMGVLDENATAATVLQKIKDKANSPDWQKRLATRLLDAGMDGVAVQAVYRPDSSWAALYDGSTIRYNLARRNPGAAIATLHEATHNATLAQLRNPGSLKGEAKKAYQDLQAIFEEVRNRPEFQGEYGVTNVEEMVAEAFSNAGFRAKLDRISDGPKTLWERFVNAITRLLFNKSAAYDSFLHKVVENAFTLGGAPIVESRSNGTAAMAEPDNWEDMVGNPNASAEAEAKGYVQMGEELADETDLTTEDVKPLTPAQRELLMPSGEFNPIGLTKFWAKQFNNLRGTTFQDREGMAKDGLIKAAKSYNPEKGIPFFSYANTVIKNHILNERRKLKVRQKYIQEDTPIREEDTETIISITPSPEDLTLQENDRNRMRKVAGEALQAVMDKASERDQGILADYAKGESLRKVGATYNMSQEGVRRVLKRFRDQVENALFLRGVTNIQEIIQPVEQATEPAVPSRRTRPEDEQSFQEETVGELEAGDIERAEPFYQQEADEFESELVASAPKASWVTLEGGTDDPWTDTFVGKFFNFETIPNNELSAKTRDTLTSIERGVAQTDSSQDTGATRKAPTIRAQRLARGGKEKGNPFRNESGENLGEFLEQFEKLTGKVIRYVKEDENRLPFAAMIRAEDPNIIYLNVDGDRNVLALVGHEWGHTLEFQDQELYKDLKRQLLPFVDDWQKRVAEIKGVSYDGWKKKSSELTSNIIGDMFVRPEFWQYLKSKDANLFTRAWNSFKRFVRGLVEQVRKSEWGTEKFISDLEAVQGIVAETLREAIRRGPYPSVIDTRFNDAELANPRGPIDQGMVAPLSERGRETRTPIFRVTEGTYKPEGILRAAGKWSQDIYKLLRGKEQKTRAAISRMQFVDKAFQKELKKTFTDNGIRIPQEVINTALGNTDNRLTQAQAAEARTIRDPEARRAFVEEAKLQNLEEFKVKQADALESLPENIQKGVTEMRELIDNLSRELIKEGDISPDLKGTIDQNVGTYLHRSYAIFDGDEWADFITSKDPDATKIRNRAESLFADYIRAQKAREYAAQIRAEGGSISPKAALEAVQDLNITAEVGTMLADYLAVADGSVVDTLRGRLPGQKNQSILKIRGDIPKEIRDLWGQYDNASLNFAKTYASIATFLENNRFLRGVLADGLQNGYLWKDGVSQGPRPADYVEIVGGEGSKSMAPLAGTYGPPVLRDAFQEYVNPRVQDWLGTLTTAAMKAKTVYSIGSIVRNFIGNPGFMLANGNVFTGDLGNAAQLAWANLTKSGQKEFREKVSKMYELGVFGENIGPQVIKELAERAKKLSSAKTPAQGLLKSMGEKLEGVRKGFEGVYSGVDDFWKVYAFDSELNKLKWANPETPIEELEQRAADIVRSTVPTYSESPQIVRNLFKGQVGRFVAPFITFTTEVIRVTYGAARRTAIELQSSNPRERAIGAARLAGLMAIASLPGIIEEATKGWFGYDDDDEEALRSGLPDWQKNATLLFLPPDANGNIRFVDLSYLNPYNYFTDTIKAITRGVANGNTPTEVGQQALWGATGQILAPFISEQIAFGAYADVIRNQKANGTDVYNPQDTPENIAKNVGWRLAQPFIPGTADSAIRIYKAAKGEVNPAGKQYDLLNEIMSPVLGQRISTNDRNQVFQFQVGRFNGTRTDAAKLFSEIFSNKGTVQPGQVADAYRRANQARYRIYQELRDNYLGSLALGMSRKEAVDTMKAKGAGEDAINQVLSGTYWRYEPSPQSIRNVREEFPERVREFQQAFQNTPARIAFQD